MTPILTNLKVCDLLAKYGKEKESLTEFEYNEKNYKITISNMVIVSKRVDEVFPPYQSVIPEEDHA